MDTCGICVDPMDRANEDLSKGQNCNHWFHVDCLLPWVRKKQTRPLCRSHMSTLVLDPFIVLPSPPPEEDLIFDPTICKECEQTETGETMLGCSRCHEWFHFRCTKIGNQSRCPEGDWFCKNCQPQRYRRLSIKNNERSVTEEDRIFGFD